MSNNINFHNRDKRPIFNCVYEGDDNLCWLFFYVSLC